MLLSISKMQQQVFCGCWQGLVTQWWLRTEICSYEIEGRRYIMHTIPQSESEVAQSCLTLCDPMDCSLPGFPVHGIFQARIPEWVSISFSRRSSRPRDWTQVSCVVGRQFTIWATKEVPQQYNKSIPQQYNPPSTIPQQYTKCHLLSSWTNPSCVIWRVS